MTQMMDPNELTAPDTWDTDTVKSIVIFGEDGKALFYSSQARCRRLGDGTLEIIDLDSVEDRPRS